MYWLVCFIFLWSEKIVCSFLHYNVITGYYFITNSRSNLYYHKSLWRSMNQHSFNFGFCFGITVLWTAKYLPARFDRWLYSVFMGTPDRTELGFFLLLAAILCYCLDISMKCKNIIKFQSVCCIRSNLIWFESIL